LTRWEVVGLERRGERLDLLRDVGDLGDRLAQGLLIWVQTGRELHEFLAGRRRNTSARLESQVLADRLRNGRIGEKVNDRTGSVLEQRDDSREDVFLLLGVGHQRNPIS